MSDAADPGRFAPEPLFAALRRALPAEPPAASAAVRLGDHALNPDFLMAGDAYTDAAVLIPVVAREPSATVILTQRTKHLSAHAGQIAFPGGKIDAGDAGPAAAALREAREEIGLDPARVTIIGYLEPYLSRTGFRIQPVVGRVETVYQLVLNPDEVAEAFEVPLDFLMTPANHIRAVRLFNGHERYFYEMPYGERYIWGVTAGIIRELYEQVFA